jgi:hypothetical protein
VAAGEGDRARPEPFLTGHAIKAATASLFLPGAEAGR